ncbi:MAG: hypothetical protein H7Z42_14850 [Roseiflexaceae bacterium]|nr:hypothetical protein [Roseiflexaceae bacterium]
MSHSYPRRGSNAPIAAVAAATFSVGQRVRIVRSPASYAYNGLVGVITAISGETINVIVDEPPMDSHCTVFYVEELDLEGDA